MTTINSNWFANILTKLCSYYTPYGEESKLHPIIIPILKDAGFTVYTGKEYLDSISSEDSGYEDAKNNTNAIYATRGENPKILLNAHLDIVSGKKDKSPFLSFEAAKITRHTALNKLGIPFSKKIPDNIVESMREIEEYFSNNKKILDGKIDQEILRNDDILYALRSLIGGDDKCGVAIVLALAVSTTAPCKITLTSGEEVGKGSRLTHKSFYDGIEFSFTPDRRDNNHFIQNISGYQLCSNEFRDFMVQVGLKHKGTIEVKDGAHADPAGIAPYVSECFNCSAGYYNAHSDKEYIVLSEVYSTYTWLKEAFERIIDGEIQATRKPVEQYSKYKKGSYSYNTDDFWDDRFSHSGYGRGYFREKINTTSVITSSRSFNSEFEKYQNFCGKIVKVLSSRYKKELTTPDKWFYKPTNKEFIGKCVGVVLNNGTMPEACTVLLKIEFVTEKDKIDFGADAVYVDAFFVEIIGEIYKDKKYSKYIGKTVRADSFSLCKIKKSFISISDDCEIKQVIKSGMQNKVHFLLYNGDGFFVIEEGDCNIMVDNQVLLTYKESTVVTTKNILFASKADFSSDDKYVLVSSMQKGKNETFILSKEAVRTLTLKENEDILKLFEV